MAVCYRHPSRETGVSCSNCGNPICPDCMTPSPVGMRCPECSRDRTKITTGTASFGRSVSARATYTLIALNAVAFLAQIGAGVGGLEGYGVVLDDFGLRGNAIADGE